MRSFIDALEYPQSIESCRINTCDNVCNNTYAGEKLSHLMRLLIKFAAMVP